MLTHRGCGGEVRDDATAEPYEHEGQLIPVIRCAKCGAEILGDGEIEWTGDDAWLEGGR